MKLKISDKDLRFIYPDENKLIACYQSLHDSAQQEYDHEYHNLNLYRHVFLRRKRFDSEFSYLNALPLATSELKFTL